jgi:methionyl-tRNA formyltransferase
VPSLRALDDEGFDIVGVVTQPDRPAGRGRQLTPSPVKEVAIEQGFEILTPERPKGDDFVAAIQALEPDISVVVAYGHILVPRVLAAPPMGSINVHASLLPELRGAAPIHRAIMRGDETTGVTIMRMVQAMDAGAILHQVREPILPDETALELSIRLSEIGAAALVEALALLSTGALEEVEQDHAKATFAPKVDRETARIDWTRAARDVANLIRGMDEVPGAWTTLDGDPVKLFRPVVVDIAGQGPRDGVADPGTLLPADGALLVATGRGTVSIGEVKTSGGRRMPAADWMRGRRVEAGHRFA